MKNHVCIASTFITISLCIPTVSSAQSQYSTSIYGPLGLNTVPNARMDQTGTIRAQFSNLDPYWHGSLGFQLAAPIYVNLRQSAEISDILENPKRLYPGVDLKLRLLQESAQIPELAIGLQSATGHKRTAAEYIALSKRYKNFDFTLGAGWGRFATGLKIDNPLNAISSHFGKRRELGGEDPNQPDDWFTGENIGFFGGIEYFTPYKGLSFKADIGGDRYTAEQAAFKFKKPSLWSLGANYKPTDFIDISLAMLGTDKIMSRISFQGLLQNFRNKSAQYKGQKIRPYRTGLSLPGEIESNAYNDDINLSYTTTNRTTASTILDYSDKYSAPIQLKQASVHMANHAGPYVEELEITPTHYGLRGPTIKLIRTDIEKALSDHQGSAEEIWHNAEIDHNFVGIQKLRPQNEKASLFKNINFILDNELSLSEEDEGLLHRTSLITDIKGIAYKDYLTMGLGLRLNLNDNLDDLENFRPQYYFPVRADIDDFADRTISVEKAFLGLTHTLTPNTHISFLSGHLEEMYAGLGGEILYRPFDKRFAIGAESWLAFKRDPLTIFNLGLNGDHVLTGHINAWYDIPKADITIGLKTGRYLAEDWGGTLSLAKEFKNGATLEGYISITDTADFDIFGSTTHADHGIRLTLPLGGYKYTPPGEIRISAKPLGRNIGQFIDNPLPLYTLSEPFTKAHLIRHWDEITD